MAHLDLVKTSVRFCRERVGLVVRYSLATGLCIAVHKRSFITALKLPLRFATDNFAAELTIPILRPRFSPFATLRVGSLGRWPTFTSQQP